MKERTIKRTVIINRATARTTIIRSAIISGVIAGTSVALPHEAHAATLMDVVTTPVTIIQDVVAPTTTTTTTPSTQAPASTSQPQSDPSSSTTTPTTNAPTTSQSTAASTTPSRSSSVAAGQPVEEAGNQSVTDMTPISYVSRQISKTVAGSWYMFAGALALLGLIVYALTIPSKKPTRKTADTRMASDKKPATALRKIIAVATLGQLKPSKG